MSLNEHDGDAQGEIPAERYYKSQSNEVRIVHVQYKDRWEQYGWGGTVSASGKGELSPARLVGFEQIGADEAVQLIEEARRLQAESEYARRDKPNSGVQGIGGWLVLPILHLAWTLVLSLFNLVDWTIPAVFNDWSDFTTTGQWFLVFTLLLGVVYVLGPAALLVLLFMKRRILPRLMVIWYSTALIDIALAVGLYATIPGVYSGGSLAGDIAKAVIPAAIWIAYFLVSERVKNTFVKGPSRGAPTRPGLQ